jgi:hypothetical protein
VVRGQHRLAKAIQHPANLDHFIRKGFPPFREQDGIVLRQLKLIFDLEGGLDRDIQDVATALANRTVVSR